MPAKSHGATSGGKRTPEFRSWLQMRRRCRDPKFIEFPRYGGRGIKVCERWENFAAFLADMGTKPTPAHTIERENNDKDYEPSNCRWATAKEQAANRRASVNPPRLREHQANNKIGVVGVHLADRKRGYWAAELRGRHLGSFKSVEAAIAARREAERAERR